MSPTIIIFVVVIAAIFVFFTYSLNKLNALYIKARNKGSDLNTSLWDRCAQFNKLLDALEKKNISSNLERVDLTALGLGMSATLMMTYAMDLDNKDKELRTLLKDHEDLKKDDEFFTPYDKFNRARREMITYSLEYNKAVNAYSNYTSGFPGGFLVNFKKFAPMSAFTYVFVDLDQQMQAQEDNAETAELKSE